MNSSEIIQVLKKNSSDVFGDNVNHLREYIIVWDIYKGLVDCIINEDDSFFYVKILNISDGVILEEYKVAKILL